MHGIPNVPKVAVTSAFPSSSRRTLSNVRVRPRKLQREERSDKKEKRSFDFIRLNCETREVRTPSACISLCHTSAIFTHPRAITSSNSVAHVIAVEYRAYSRPIHFRRFILSQKTTTRSVGLKPPLGPNIIFSILSEWTKSIDDDGEKSERLSDMSYLSISPSFFSVRQRPWKSSYSINISSIPSSVRAALYVDLYPGRSR